MTRFCLFSTKFKMLGTLEAQLLFGLALFTFQSQHYLTSRLGLFVKDWLGLSTKPHLLGIITALALGKVGGLARLVLRHLVRLMLAAFHASTICIALLGNIHHSNACVLYMQDKL